MHVYALNGTAEIFPYSIGQLRKDNPQTSFPKNPSDDTLASWGVYRVVYADEPTHDPKTQKVQISAKPALIAGHWTLTKTVLGLSPEEVTQRSEQQADDTRTKRDKMIADTDWMALSDNTLTPAWATYRQALRDITDHVNFPYLADEDWPVKP